MKKFESKIKTLESKVEDMVKDLESIEVSALNMQATIASILFIKAASAALEVWEYDNNPDDVIDHLIKYIHKDKNDSLYSSSPHSREEAHQLLMARIEILNSFNGWFVAVCPSKG